MQIKLHWCRHTQTVLLWLISCALPLIRDFGWMKLFVCVCGLIIVKFTSWLTIHWSKNTGNFSTDSGGQGWCWKRELLGFELLPSACRNLDGSAEGRALLPIARSLLSQVCYIVDTRCLGLYRVWSRGLWVFDSVRCCNQIQRGVSFCFGFNSTGGESTLALTTTLNRCCIYNNVKILNLPGLSTDPQTP